MIMMGLRFAGDVPFREVFIHALVRDAEGQKMSKSRGNVIDPLTMIEKYGADAFRFTLVALAAQGRDIRLSEDRIEGYRHFCNKVWNASRFVMMSTEGADHPITTLSDLKLDLADRWIISRAYQLIASVTDSLEAYKFNEAAQYLYQFLWHEFCDWYLEMSKQDIKDPVTQVVMYKVLEKFVRCLHPFMPFITEEIWQHLPGRGKSLALAAFPSPQPSWRNERAEEEMRLLQDLVVEVRTIRAENKIPPQQKIKIWLRSPGEKEKELLPEIQTYILVLASSSEVRLWDHFPPEKGLLKGVAGGWEVAIPPEGLFDHEAEISRLEREIKKIQAEMEKVEGRLRNQDFVAKAPQPVIEKARKSVARLRDKKSKLEKSLEHLKQ